MGWRKVRGKEVELCIAMHGMPRKVRYKQPVIQEHQPEGKGYLLYLRYVHTMLYVLHSLRVALALPCL